ncbi:hypothetical protein SAMN02799630_00181 [Paenibacillus sp. UNCCL117]|uniref:hypothetical protein n=1 Tax=unclassified Paenibacillus TaxID=185978 RepID=UPI00087E4EFB|nr:MULTISPECIES: hypothetical protein [unclassified Paenibacillus]SDC49499.1 hypothetical protein SAMN04488602_102351 [Paenibacillus sp. cl123]SFW11749.1 hypothetical protein SAMN02799630_00181 [Paenibacillus sp. UNCCL117]
MDHKSDTSWKEWKLVPSASMQERLETVRTLREDELELYEIAKDKLTGEHYLHYAYLHRNIGAIGTNGQDEVFHQLLPLESDDVLGIMFSEQPYAYPEHWQKPFLRNGPEGDYVWFDPSYTEAEGEYEALGQQILEELNRFKAEGDLSEAAVERLLRKLEADSEEK